MTRRQPDTGQCGNCGRRRRIDLAGTIYGHKRPDHDDEMVWCVGSYHDPVKGTIRQPAATRTVAEPVKLNGDLISVKLAKGSWADDMTPAEVAGAVTDLILAGPQKPGQPAVINIAENYQALADSNAEEFEAELGWWDKYYWCAVGSVALVLLAVGAFAGGVIWSRR